MGKTTSVLIHVSGRIGVDFSSISMTYTSSIPARWPGLLRKAEVELDLYVFSETSSNTSIAVNSLMTRTESAAR